MHLELFRKALRVALRARRRAEAWHRYRADARARQAEHIKRVRRHKQCQRGIETARKPNDRRFAADVLQSRRETRRLHFEDLFISEDEEKEIVFPAGMSYTWLSDPYCFNGEIICSAGKLVNGKALMCALLKYNISTGKVSELPIKARNDHLIYPVFNEKYLVYFDANQKKETVQAKGFGHKAAAHRQSPARTRRGKSKNNRQCQERSRGQAAISLAKNP